MLAGLLRTDEDQTPPDAYVMMRHDGEDLTQLHPDAARLVKAPESAKAQRGNWTFVIVSFVVLLATLSFVLYRILHSDENPEGTNDIWFGLAMPVAFFATLGAIAGFVMASGESRSTRPRIELAEAYRRLVATRPRAEYATVEKVTYSADESTWASRIQITCVLPTGERIRAVQPKWEVYEDSEGVKQRFLPTQVPLYADTVTVFRSRSVPDMAIVQGNHSWSLLHAEAQR